MIVEISNLHFDDYKGLLEAMKAAYPDWHGNYWSAGSIDKLISKFPEGQLVLKVDEKVAGIALSIIVDYQKFGDKHTYKQITGNYTSFSFLYK